MEGQEGITEVCLELIRCMVGAEGTFGGMGQGVEHDIKDGQ